MTAYIPFSLRRESFKDIAVTDERVEFVMDDAGLEALQTLVRYAREGLSAFAAKHPEELAA